MIRQERHIAKNMSVLFVYSNEYSYFCIKNLKLMKKARLFIALSAMGMLASCGFLHINLFT